MTRARTRMSQDTDSNVSTRRRTRLWSVSNNLEIWSLGVAVNLYFSMLMYPKFPAASSPAEWHLIVLVSAPPVLYLAARCSFQWLSARGLGPP